MLESKTTYQNKQLISSFGRKIESNNLVEKTFGLEPVYCVSGVEGSCEIINKNINFSIKEQKNMEINEEKLDNVQDTITSSNKILDGLTNFLEEFTIESSGKPNQKLEAPEKISQFVNKNCKKCMQRGIVGWIYLDKNKKPIQFNKDNPYFIMPKLCKCVYPELIKILKDQNTE